MGDADLAAKPPAPSAPYDPAAAVPVATAVPIESSSPTHVHVHIETPRSQSASWSTGICGCTDNCCNLWMVACCPCVTYGQISERIGHNGCCKDCSCLCSGLLYLACGGNCILTCLLRGKVAEAIGIKANCFDDFCMALCCDACVLCQMANHLDLQKDGCSFQAPPRMETMQR